MKSLYAVSAQMILSASNYMVFVLMARQLSPDLFVSFSTSIGLNMLAYAVAEGGVSYVAPRELARRSDKHANSLAGAFVTISLALYILMMVVGYFLWNTLSRDPLDIKWVTAYAIYFVPTLLIPSWVTCKSMDLIGMGAIGVARMGMVISTYWFPGVAILVANGMVFLTCTCGLLLWLNRSERVIGWADRNAIRLAILHLREVILFKTISYGLYALLPLVVAALRGNMAASSYITGERLKALYATCFQPLIQTVYLWQFQPQADKGRKRIIGLALDIFNLMAGGGLLLFIQMGVLGFLGERFVEVADMPVYVIAACLSVATASLLHLRVFPSGEYRIFRRASVGQMVAFASFFAAMAAFSALSPAWALCAAEAVLFFAVFAQWILLRGRQNQTVVDLAIK